MYGSQYNWAGQEVWSREEPESITLLRYSATLCYDCCMGKISLSPRTKDILKLIGAGVVLTSLIMAPGLGYAARAIQDEYRRAKRERDWKEWEKYNLPRLRYILKRMMRQNLIKQEEHADGTTTITLTQKGKLRNLTYNIETMEIHKPKAWDGRWRLVIYDITKFKKREADMLRRVLTRLKMYRLQKSVYLYPYPCKEELEFLRHYFSVPEGVLYLTVSGIENDDAFRRYFGVI